MTPGTRALNAFDDVAVAASSCPYHTSPDCLLIVYQCIWLTVSHGEGGGAARGVDAARVGAGPGTAGRGLHSSTFQLNLSRFYRLCGLFQ